MSFKGKSFVMIAIACALACVVPGLAFAAPASSGSSLAAQQSTALSAAAQSGKVKHIADGAYVLRCGSSTADVALDDPGASTASGVQMQAWKVSGANAQTFYVCNEGDDLVSLQCVASGLYLADQKGKVVQLADGASDNLRWKPLWDDGYTFVNEATGKVLALSGSQVKKGVKAVTAASSGKAVQKWFLKGAPLVAAGCYQIGSKVGTYLDVKNGSYAYNANVRAFTYNGSGAQTFRFVKRAGGYYQIQNAQTFLMVAVKDASRAAKANVVQVKSDKKAAAQLWKPSLDRSGYLVFTNKKSGKVLEVKNSSSKASVNVRQNTLTNAKGQLWRLEDVADYSLSGNSTLDRRVAKVLRTHGTLRSAFNWTVNHNYRNGERFWKGPRILSDAKTKSYANDFYAHKSGNCYRFACMFSWLARGLGYKTNVVSGWVQAASGGRAPHGWVEVYQGKTTYVCDPDLAHEIPGHNWFMCTYATSPTVYHNW